MKHIDVLDKGYVNLTHTTKSVEDDRTCQQTLYELDKLVVASARMSTGGELKGDEKDRKLLHYLIEHEHGTPLEMPTFRFEMKMPLFVIQQLLRHRWSSFNQASGRYTEAISEDYYVPAIFRAQDTKNKQGSLNIDLSDATIYCDSTNCDAPSSVRHEYIAELEQQKFKYERMVKVGVAKELARNILGSTFYSKIAWSVNARSLINFLILRLDGHAQWETQEYAKTVCKMFAEEMPWTVGALEKLFTSVPWTK